MSVDNYKSLKEASNIPPSFSHISTYRTINVPLFSPKRTMDMSSRSQLSSSTTVVSHKTEGNIDTSVPIEQSKGPNDYQNRILVSIKSALRSTGNFMWDSLGWSTKSAPSDNISDSKNASAAVKKSMTHNQKFPEYFVMPRKSRKLANTTPAKSNEINENSGLNSSFSEEPETERILSFSKDPFNWNKWKTTQISSRISNIDSQSAPYGTTLRTRKINRNLSSRQNHLILRDQSEDIEYLKMIYNGEYKVPKIIENERDEQMRLMQGDMSKNKKAKKSIVDLTEKIKNILLESRDRRQTINDDLIFVREQKVSPLEKKRKEYNIQQLRFDRSLLEFDKEFKTYNELLEERKRIQDQVRKKIELTKQKRLIPTISDTDKIKVQTIWKKQENFVLMNKDNLEVNVRDFKTLTPRRWLNDTIIEYFMKYIEKHNERMVAFNSFFYTNLSERGYQSVRRWMKRKKAKITDLDKIFVPINLNQSHWALGVIDIARKRVVYVDSLSNGPNAVSFAILNDLQKYVVEESNNTIGSDFELENLACPQQPNGFDCGIYLCMNTLCLSQDSPLHFDQKDAVNMRTYIGHLILTEGIQQ